MASIVERGSTITLDLLTEKSNGDAVDFTPVTVSIIDASGDTVVSLAVPTHIALGHYQYDYIVAADAELGAWIVRWFGTFDGDDLTIDEGFTVLRAGAVTPPVAGGETCEPWATHEDATGACATYGVDADLLDEAMQVATDVLWNLTGRKWSGLCSDSIRPQAQWRPYDGPARWWPAAVSGSAAPWGFCSCHRGRETGCTNVPEIKLPGSPVVAASIVVKIDGLEFFDFRLDDHRYLVRTDGQGWPCCQDLRADDTEDRTFSIAYDFDRRPPIGGRRAAASLGCELALLYTPDLTARCRIPKRATQVNRQGVTISLADTAALFKDGITGLPEVDLWVMSVREGAKRRKMSVMIPGRWRSARRVGR